MSQAIFDAFTVAVRAKLAEACARYNLSFKPEDVPISYKLRGMTAGYAGYKGLKFGPKKFYLKFNAEAVVRHNQDMTQDTIPHEIAHLVCFDQPQHGENHDSGWKRVCRTLGGDDSRCHDMTLTAAKVTQKYTYRLPSGREIELGPKYHANIQGHKKQYFMRSPREEIRAHHWVDAGTVVKQVASTPALPGLNIVRSDIPAVNQFASKREKAEAIYKVNKHLARGEVIKLFVAHAEMTPAGAATYYQNFKKAGI